jgi:hypothetical protein
MDIAESNPKSRAGSSQAFARTGSVLRHDNTRFPRWRALLIIATMLATPRKELSTVFDSRARPREKPRPPMAPASGAPSAADRPARKTNGSAPAGASGTRSIREPSARRACTNGLKPNASRALAGRHIRTGMCSNALTSGSTPHTAAKAETTGCARACRRAFDSQPRGRLRSAVWCPARRRCAQGTRFGR